MSTEEIQSIRDSLHRIELALVGDPAMGNKGLVARMSEVEKEASENTTWRESVKARVGVVAAVVSFLATAALHFGSSLISRK